MYLLKEIPSNPIVAIRGKAGASKSMLHKFRLMVISNHDILIGLVRVVLIILLYVESTLVDQYVNMIRK